MNATIKATDKKCMFCPSKGGKERFVFEVRSEGFSGMICAEHLTAFLKQSEEEAVPENGRPHAVTT